MTKKLAYEQLESRYVAIQDDIIALGEENQRLKDEVKELKLEVAKIGEEALGAELDGWEAEDSAEAATAKWDDTRFALREYGGHTVDCAASWCDSGKPHPNCTCGWNYYATVIERG